MYARSPASYSLYTGTSTKATCLEVGMVLYPTRYSGVTSCTCRSPLSHTGTRAIRLHLTKGCGSSRTAGPGYLVRAVAAPQPAHCDAPGKAIGVPNGGASRLQLYLCPLPLLTVLTPNPLRRPPKLQEGLTTSPNGLSYIVIRLSLCSSSGNGWICPDIVNDSEASRSPRTTISR